ncbi:MAG TPA: ATP-binding protein, partial [Anaerolineaceae bacterium]
VSTQIMKHYQGKQPNAASFYDETSPTNTREFVYYQPVEGRPWAVVLAVPARLAQQMALDIAFPLLVMLLALSLAAFLFLRLSLRAVTSSLAGLSQESTLIAQGQLDHQLFPKGVDEVGRLSLAFEQMRMRLKARLEELNSLLRVSQGVAANLDISESVRPILEAALTEDACSSRLVLVPDVTLEPAGPRDLVAFGAGPEAQLYAPFDQQLFDLVRQQDPLSLPNVGRSRRLQIPANAVHPGALLALAVHHENQYYGVLWVAYDHPRNFSDEEIRFLTTLSGEAALAAASARLYATAEVGRQRMEAVLNSTPEPVLVIDEQARLLLLNPAAVQVPGLILSAIEARPIQDVVGPPELLQLLTAPLTERITSREISLANGRIYYTSISPVIAEGRPVGRVCILRDITHFKELEQLKSDFVSTVSHDLRSPLTLMRGYATMLQMVGDLNEQQKAYVRKIYTGVENMTRLVNNLLDLGRIEAGIGLQIERVAISAVTEEVLNSLQLQAVQKDIHLTQEAVGISENLVVEADKALIQQALYNLVENAIKYTSVGGQVKVRMEGRTNTALIEVQDSGMGIAPLDLPHVFEKFYRSGRREAYQQRGTGLGLAIVESIAKRHEGRVWVDSQLGKGSIFCLEVPCEQPQKLVEENKKTA